MLRFTKHAKQKFRILADHSFDVTEKQVVGTVTKPDLLDHSRSPLIIAQREFDRTHVLRVVYREEDGDKIVITFYPGRIKQYEKKAKS